MGKNVLQLTENGTVLASLEFYINDFIPIVSLDVDYGGDGLQILGNKFDKTTILDKPIDEEFIEQPLEAVKITKDVSLKFDIKKAHSKSEDDTGDIWVQTTGVNIINADGSTTDKIQIKSKKYDENFILKLSSKDIKEDAIIDFYGCTDDNDSTVSDIHSGRVSINPRCQKKLKMETHSPLILNEADKHKLIAVFLAESAHGHPDLYDIAWIYFNFVSKDGVEKGLNNSTPYSEKNKKKKWNDYKVWIYYLGYGEKYKDDEYSSTETISEFVKNNGFFKTEILPIAKIAIEHVKNRVFSGAPMHPYKNWYAQGYHGDLNLNPSDKRGDQWHMARQYYILQMNCEVEEQYVILLEAFEGPGYTINRYATSRKKNRDHTTFLFDVRKIERFFKENDYLLPKNENDIKSYRLFEGNKFMK